MSVIRSLSNSEFLTNLRLLFYKKTGLFFRIKRFIPSAYEPLRTVLLIKSFDIELIFDVGANRGQFANELFRLGYKGKVISFEPSGRPHSDLKRRAKSQAGWIVPEPMAIGNEDGEVLINEYKESVFNSILSLKTTFAEGKPYLEKISSQRVPLRKMDSIASEYIDINSGENFMLKIDTQGFEKQVISGAKELLPQVSMIKIEVPIVPIYEKVAWTFYDIMDFMRSNSFYPVNFTIEGANENGMVRTVDFTFLNSNKHEIKMGKS